MPKVKPAAISTAVAKKTAAKPNAKSGRKLLSQLKNVGYTRPEIEDTLSTLLALTLDELEHVRTDSRSTAFEVTIAAAIIDNAAKGNLVALENLLLRLFGKPGSAITPSADLPLADDTPTIIVPTNNAITR